MEVLAATRSDCPMYEQKEEKPTRYFRDFGAARSEVFADCVLQMGRLWPGFALLRRCLTR